MRQARDAIAVGKLSGAVGTFAQIDPRVEEHVAKAMGLTADLTERGLGVRSQRYAMVIQDGVVKTLNIEDAPGKADISGADNLVKSL